MVRHGSDSPEKRVGAYSFLFIRFWMWYTISVCVDEKESEIWVLSKI